MIGGPETYIDAYLRQKNYRLIDGIVLYRGGSLVFERYYNGFTAASRHNLKSMWKSILSLCAGVCLDKGYIGSPDDPVHLYLPEFDGRYQPSHRLITVRHLLTLSSGIAGGAAFQSSVPMLGRLMRSDNCVAEIARTPMSGAPGVQFVYNEYDVILLSAVIGRASGMNAYELCDKYLYAPLGITSGAWALLPGGVSYNISVGREHRELEAQSDLSARDLVKIASVLLENGRGLVSESYVRQTLTPSAANGAYGFLWWLMDGGFASHGFGGQNITVLTEPKLIYVLQATPSGKGRDYPDVLMAVLDKLK